LNATARDRRSLLLIPSAFLASLAIGIVNFAMLFVVKERFHAGAEAVGWFTALWAMAYFAGCMLLKGLSDKLGPRVSMAMMNLGTALLFVAFFLLPSLASAFVVYGLYGFLCAFFWPPMMGWLSTGLEGSRLSKAMSAFSLAWSSGGIFAPYLGGLLAEKDLLLPVYVGVGCFLVNALLILGTRRGIPTPTIGNEVLSGVTVEDRSTPLRYPAWIGVFLVYALLAVFFNIFPVFAKDELLLSESRIGFLLLVRALFAAMGFYALGRFEFWHFRKRYIFLGVALLLFLDLAFLPLRSPLAFGLGLAALGLVQALCYNASIFYGASGARDRTRRMTIHESLLTAGQILGSIGGGFVYAGLSWSAIFACLAVLIVLGLLAQIILVRRRAS
jgi:DHA1 family multidrug resistance protein-like MFS transporter/DHA1 family quinolone resistance protein-like MFS transporter